MSPTASHLLEDGRGAGASITPCLLMKIACFPVVSNAVTLSMQKMGLSAYR